MLPLQTELPQSPLNTVSADAQEAASVLERVRLAQGLLKGDLLQFGEL